MQYFYKEHEPKYLTLNDLDGNHEGNTFLQRRDTNRTEIMSYKMRSVCCGILA